MNFSDKLKEIRKNQGLSQEQLAEKIGVSRQAITKWETGKGLPDIENVLILSEIFKVTIDELIKDTVALNESSSGCSSETVFDIDGEKHFDIKLLHAKRLSITSGADEKLRIVLRSDTLENLDEMFKIKLDEHRHSLDADCVRTDKFEGISNRELEEALEVEVSLPRKLSEHVEISAFVKTLEISKLDVKELEFDGDAAQTVITGSSGRIELTTKNDMEITADAVAGRLELYQFRANAVLHIPEAECPKVENKGRKSEVFFIKDGKPADFTPADNENSIVVTGVGSQLTVDLG